MLFSFLLFLSAQAVPLQITQQGRILDASGASVSGTHDLTFRIYDAETSGNILWEETVSTAFSNGYYASILGTDEVNNPLDSVVLQQYPLFLELELDSQGAMTPRQPITSAPYAQIAGEAEFATVAESVEGGTVDATEIMINGTAVIDGSGNWVGASNVTWSDIDSTTIPAGLDDGDDVLGELDVEDYITNESIDLATGSSMNGSTILTEDTLSVDWTDINNQPNTIDSISCSTGEILSYNGSWVCSSDPLLSESTVETYITNSAIDLHENTTIGGTGIITDADATLQSLSCGDSELIVWDASNQQWDCTAYDTTQYSGTDFCLSNQSCPIGEAMIGIDTSGALVCEAVTSSGCSVSRSFDGYVQMLCGDESYIVQGTSLQTEKIALGSKHTCAIDQNSKIECWGDNTYNQVSDAPTGDFVDIVAGTHFSCALDTQGSVTCWGRNNRGQVSNAGNLSSTYISVSSGHEHACAISTTGAAECWGSDTSGQVSNTPLATFSNIAAGYAHTCGLNSLGGVQCWGDDTFSQLTNTPTTPLASLSSGYNHLCGLDQSGNIVCWGDDSEGQITDAPTGTYTAISSSSTHICVLDNAQEVQCWGENSYKQITNAPQTELDTIVGGPTANHSCSTIGANYFCWGDNTIGQSNGVKPNITPTPTFYTNTAPAGGISTAYCDSGDVMVGGGCSTTSCDRNYSSTPQSSNAWKCQISGSCKTSAYVRCVQHR